MTFLQQIKLGYTNYIKAIGFLFKHRLTYFFLFPIILFVGIYWLGLVFKSLEKEMMNDLTLKSKDIKTVNELIKNTLKILFFDSLYVVFTQFTLYIMVVVLSPVLSILSQKIDRIIQGAIFKYTFKDLLIDTKRALIITFRNFIWYYVIVGIVLGIILVFNLPIPNFLFFAIPFFIAFYYYGFSFLDYSSERYKLNIEESISFVSKYKGLAISIGSIYSIFFMFFFYLYRNFDKVPIDTFSQILWGSLLILFLFLSAISPILAITSATMSFIEIRKTELKKQE